MIKVQLIKDFTDEKNRNNQRLVLFKRLIGEIETCELVEEKSEPNFTIYFDTDFIEGGSQKSIVELLKFKDLESSKTILDLTTDQFDDDKIGPILTLCVICAGFVTCLNADMQESIYENTGRLAYIIENPVLETHFKLPDTDVNKEINDPYILWYGLPREIFTVRQFQVQNKEHNINTVIVYSTASNKIVTGAFNRANIIFLPETFDAIGEQNRLVKVQLAVLEGKFVVAPNLPVDYRELAYNGSLEDAIELYRKYDIATWISSKQQVLKEIEGTGKSLFQLQKAFELAPTDDFLANLDYFLDSEEIEI